MDNRWIRTAAILGAITVALGAFATHGLRNTLSPSQLASFETGVRYQFFHTLAIFGIGLLPSLPSSLLNKAAYCMLAGIILFSGSIYLFALMSASEISIPSFLRLLTPLGGLLLIAGWIALLMAARKKKGAS